jgi:membrane protease YdiL (CAAX protease family)
MIPSWELPYQRPKREPAFPAAWFILAALIALAAFGQNYDIAHPPGLTPDSAAVRAVASEYGQKYDLAFNALQKQKIISEAIEKISAVKLTTSGAQGSRNRMLIVLRKRLNPDAKIDDLKLNAATDDITDASLQTTAAQQRTKLNEALQKLYGSPRPPPNEIKSLTQTILEITGSKWPYSLIEEQPAKASGRDLVKLTLMGAASAGALVVGVVLIIAYLIMRANGLWIPKAPPIGGATKIEADTLALRMVLYLLVFGSGSLVVPIVRPFVSDAWLETAVALFMLPILIAIIHVPIFGSRLSLRTIGYRWNNFWTNLGSAVYAYFATIPVVFALVIISQNFPKDLPSRDHPITQELTDPSRIPAVLVSAVLIAPFLEELFFRGCLFQGILARTRRPAVAFFLSSLAFASVHPQGAAAWLPLAGVGFMCALVFWQTGSLAASLILHALWNFTLIMLELVGR